MSVREILSLAPGSLIKLSSSVGSPVDLYVGGARFGSGEIVKAGDSLGRADCLRETEAGLTEIVWKLSTALGRGRRLGSPVRRPLDSEAQGMGPDGAAAHRAKTAGRGSRLSTGCR